MSAIQSNKKRPHYWSFSRLDSSKLFSAAPNPKELGMPVFTGRGGRHLAPQSKEVLNKGEVEGETLTKTGSQERATAQAGISYQK